MKKHLTLIFSLSSLLLSDTAELENLFNLSLEELMNVEVTTVSQEKEKASKSLAVVTVITSTQLKQMGALNLYEALSFVPGIQLNETYFGNTVLTFRGITPGLYNNKALFMVNGHPVHEKVFGASFLESVPLDMVDKIEVVRSPSSVLYGTNAISGVVNVITKKGLEFSNEVTFRAGSNNHYYGALSLHDTHVSMGASFQKDDGYDFSGTKDELGQDIDKDYKNDLNNLFVDLYGDQWRVQGSYFRSKKEKLGLNPFIQHGGINDNEAFYLDLNKEFTLGKGNLNVWLRYDYFDRNLHAEHFLAPGNPVGSAPITIENKVERYSGEIQYKSRASEDLHYIIGTSYEYDKTDPLIGVFNDGSLHSHSPFRQKYSQNTISFYTQGTYTFSEKLTGVAGFRIDDNTDSSAVFNPRVGVNYEYIPDTYIKLLYSEAYRNPVFLEKYANVPTVLSGDEDLKREKIRTYEVGVDSQINRHHSLQATLYYLELRDEITRKKVSSGSGEVKYYNADGRNMYGLELAWNAIINEKTELMTNASYTNGEVRGEEETHPDYIAHFTANAILSYHLNKKWSVSLSDQYVDAKSYHTNSGDTGEIDSYNLANITLTYLNRPFETNLYIKNIFDEDYTYPESVRKNLKDIPGGPGTSAYLTLRYYF